MDKRMEKIERFNTLFKNNPTKCQIIDERTILICFDDIQVKASIEEKGSCIGKYYRWSLDSQVSEDKGENYIAYRSYLIIEPLKQNKNIPINELMKEYKLNNGIQTTCGL